jgi:hypothetical protein
LKRWRKEVWMAKYESGDILETYLEIQNIWEGLDVKR